MMKKLSAKYAGIIRVIAGALLIAAAVILSGIIPIPIPHLSEYFPFVGTVLVMLANWIMYRTENKDLSDLGIDLEKRNLLFLPIGLLLGIATFFTGFFLTAWNLKEQFHVNSNINYANIFRQLYWILPTAAAQQFMIRGYCFKKLITISNQTIAIIISGLCFIAMHDFWNGNVYQIIAYCATLFIGHLMFCTALLKSETLYFAIGIHWGNNFANSVLFTEGQRDTSLLFTTNPNTAHSGLGQFAITFFLANIAFVILTIILWRNKMITKKQVEKLA